MWKADLFFIRGLFKEGMLAAEDNVEALYFETMENITSGNDISELKTLVESLKDNEVRALKELI